MIHKHSIFFVLLLLLSVPTTWAQERAIRPVETNIRQALVIGNSNYAHAGILRNPINDARAIGSTLQQLGFQVETLMNATQPEMDQAIRKFGRQLLGNNGVGLFYYAGHGMQINGENYLLPVEINPSTEADVRYRGVPVGQLLGQMEAADNGMNIVILDACRNNPFARSFRSSSRGLAQMTAPAGTFISYATAPGKEAADGAGDNGLFTAKLLEHMKTPGLKLEEVFKLVRSDVQRESNDKQVPWDSSSVTGEFFFLEPKNKEEEILRKREEEIRRKEEEILRKREEEVLRREEEILRKREEEVLRREEEILRKREEINQGANQEKDIDLKPTGVGNEKFVIPESQSHQDTLNGDSNKFKLMGGYFTGSLDLETDFPSSYNEDVDATGLFFSARYFFGQNIGIDFLTGSGNINKVTVPEESANYQDKVTGNFNSTVLGIIYSWGGYENSIFGKWWTILVGVGVGSSTAIYTLGDANEEVTATTQGVTTIVGFDYRTENNWLLGLTFYGLGGNATGSRVEQLENEGGNVTAGSNLVTIMTGYQFD